MTLNTSIKLMIVGLIFLVIFFLVQSFYFLILKPKPELVLNALKKRIGYSVLIFVILLLGANSEWIIPHVLY